MQCKGLPFLDIFGRCTVTTLDVACGHPPSKLSPARTRTVVCIVAKFLTSQISVNRVETASMCRESRHLRHYSESASMMSLTISMYTFMCGHTYVLLRCKKPSDSDIILYKGLPHDENRTCCIPFQKNTCKLCFRHFFPAPFSVQFRRQMVIIQPSSKRVTDI